MKTALCFVLSLHAPEPCTLESQMENTVSATHSHGAGMTHSLLHEIPNLDVLLCMFLSMPTVQRNPFDGANQNNHSVK